MSLFGPVGELYLHSAEQSAMRPWTLLEPGAIVFPLVHSVLPTKEDEFSFLCIPLPKEQLFPSSKPHQVCRVVCWVCLILKFKKHIGQ